MKSKKETSNLTNILTNAEETRIGINHRYINSNKILPQMFKVARSLDYYRLENEKNIITTLNSTISGADVIEDIRNIIDVSPMVLHSCLIELSKSVYNDSKMIGNEQETGMAVNGVYSDGTRVERTLSDGKYYYRSETNVKIKDLTCAILSTDKPSSKEKASVARLLNGMQQIFLNDNEYEASPLILIRKLSTDAKGSNMMSLSLHPIFTKGILKNFSLYPQNILEQMSAAVKRLGRKKRRSIDMNLYSFLNLHNKTKPLTISRLLLLEKINMLEAYKNNKKRVISYLDEAFQLMVEMKVLKKKPKEERIKDEPENCKYIFTFVVNKDEESAANTKESILQD